ncbi:MAG: TolC family protein [Planctomycetota bacterium]|jgi:outer membrane protein TolC
MNCKYIFLPILFGLLVGCKTYARKPLNLEEFKSAWKARSPDNSSVSDYAREIVKRDERGSADFNSADGLSLEEAEILALFFNPDLRIARSKAGIALAGAKEAGRWEDPELGVSASRIMKSIPRPWEYEIELGFALPVSGRLGLERDAAFSEYGAALTEVYYEECGKLIELRDKWLEWSAVLEKIKTIKAFLTEFETILKVADRLAEGGELGKIDARLFTIEKAVRLDELKTLEDAARENELEIKSMIGLTPEKEVKLLPRLTFELRNFSSEERRKRLEQKNPGLIVLRAAYEVTERTLRLEVRRQYPDLGLGLIYENAEGPSGLGLGFSIPIPFFNRNRRAIAEAEAARRAARVGFETAYEKLVSELLRSEIRLESAISSRKRLENEIAPMVDQQLKDAKKLAELGEFDPLLIHEALTTSLESKHKLVEACLSEAQAKNLINSMVSPRFIMPRNNVEDEK